MRVLPEVEAPGHGAGWSRAFPDMLTACPGASSASYTRPMWPLGGEVAGRVAAVVGELAPIFPEPLFHLGGDEVHLACYAANATLAAYMAAHNMTGPAALEAKWLSRILPTLEAAGKRPVVWQEILDNLASVGMASVLPSDVIIESWKGGDELTSVAKQGYTTFFTLYPDWYLDHFLNTGPHGSTALWNDWPVMVRTIRNSCCAACVACAIVLAAGPGLTLVARAAMVS